MYPAHGRDRLSWLLVTVGVVALLLGVAWLFTAPAEQAATPVAPARSEPPARAGQAASPQQPRPAARTAEPRARPAPPRLVSLPTLGVVAPVDPIQAEAGTLVPPDDPSRLGWWSDGAKPGADRGSVLITGHAVRNGDGALDELARLARGDRVVVETARGRIRYEVQRVRVFHKGTVARHAQRLFAQDVPGRLVLVTCADWDGERYLSNVVATATPLR